MTISRIVKEAWWLDACALVATYACFETLLHHIVTLSASSYEQPVIAFEVFRGLASNGLALALTTIVVIVVVVLVVRGGSVFGARARSIFDRWVDIAEGGRLRMLATVSGLVLVWYLTTIPPNYYFGQSYIVDRLLLMVALGLAVWRPIGVLPLIALVIAFVGQMDYPLGGYSWAAHLLPRQVLLMVGSLLVVRVFLPRVETRSFLVVLCCLIAANYFWSGVDKLALNWLARDHIANLVPATHANGWLAQLREDQIEQLASWLAIVGWPMKLFTICAEVGAIGFFVSRRTPRLFLIGWSILHVGIFATTGICFWMWVAVDIALLATFFLGQKPAWVFDRRTQLLSVLLIVSSTLWTRPTALAWLDSPVSYSFRFDTVNEKGEVTHLAPLFFAPNEYELTLGDLDALIDEPLLGISWGAIRDQKVLDRLESATSLEEIW
ncbi:MAG: hypothetical protein KJO98_04555, partial [Rhodothermia bacterium]|nr:hypothetical protein [Rhodothermia bacterium]